MSSLADANMCSFDPSPNSLTIDFAVAAGVGERTRLGEGSFIYR